METVMVFVLFMVLMGGSLILERQEKIHWLELELVYRRAGIEIPKPVPLLSKFEAVANIALGALLTAAGGYLLYALIQVESILGKTRPTEIVSLVLGGGIALMILGARALMVYQKLH